MVAPWTMQSAISLVGGHLPDELEAITWMYRVGAAKLRHAKIMLMRADGYTDMEISEDVGLCERHVVRIRRKFVKSGVHTAPARATRKDAGIPNVMDYRAEPQLITIACSTNPEGLSPIMHAFTYSTATSPTPVTILRSGK